MNKIIGIGEILWDVLPDGKVLGGAPANFAYHVSQYGFDGIAVSAIGKDLLGDEIKQILGNKNLNTILEELDFPTGTVKVTLDGNGIPQYEICENVAWDNIHLSTELKDLIPLVQTVCFGSLAQRNSVSRKTINLFLDLLSDDVLKVFDINLRQNFYNKEILNTSLEKCNILKINDEEVKIIKDLFEWNNLEEIELCQKILVDYNLKMVILTKGTEGSLVITPEYTSFKKTPIVKVVDTVGAGDSFTASFVAGILKGKKVEEAHAIAVELSAFVCTQKGAMPEIPLELKNKLLF